MESYILLLVIIVIVALGVFFNMYPKFPPSERKEGFSSPAVAPNTPKCIQRSIDAQVLLRLFPPCSDPSHAPTEDDTDREELNLILMKLTCLDADATNSGVGGYNTLKLKYNTSHDAVPLTNFVGRCLNNGTNQRDIDIVIEKYDQRGKELIRKISSRIGMDSKEAQENYNSLITNTMRTLTTHCLAMRSSLDKPFGPRDPGFSTPYSVERLAPFS
jgi:hypothetical protein